MQRDSGASTPQRKAIHLSLKAQIDQVRHGCMFQSQLYLNVAQRIHQYYI
jgi:hypothetical protein